MVERGSNGGASSVVHRENGGGTGGLVSLLFFFVREFFSRALLSERLEQATPNGVVILKLLI